LDKEDMPILNFAPSAETSVYLLLGLLWDYIPYNFMFEEFEVDPYRKGYDFKKVVYACGKEWVDGDWVNVNFEFKLKSSGLLSDVKRYPNFNPDWLICWLHDAKAAEVYSGNILCLYDIYQSLPEDEKNKIMKQPNKNIKNWYDTSTMEELLTRFSRENKIKVNYILEEWNEYIPGNSEIILLNRGVTAARVCAYSSEYILIKDKPELKDYLKKRYKTEKSGLSLRLLLKDLDEKEIKEILREIEGYYNLDT